MHARHWLGAVLVNLGLAGILSAQNASTFLPIGGFSPQQIRNVPVDTSRTVAPVNFPAAQPVQFPILSRFRSLIPRFRLATPTHPVGTPPRPATAPSTPPNQNAFQPQLPFFPQQ